MVSIVKSKWILEWRLTWFCSGLHMTLECRDTKHLASLGVRCNASTIEGRGNKQPLGSLVSTRALLHPSSILECNLMTIISHPKCCVKDILLLPVEMQSRILAQLAFWNQNPLSYFMYSRMNLNTISLALVCKVNKIIKCKKIYQNFSSVFGGSHYTAQSFIHKEAKKRNAHKNFTFQESPSLV